MATRNILYTMLTRAQDRLILVGSAKTFAMAARNGKTTERMTGLKDL
jgi:ATP-dependent exoDNAse (exonuclease V) alpha subunit